MQEQQKWEKKKSAAGYTFTLFGIISEMNFQT